MNRNNTLAPIIKVTLGFGANQVDISDAVTTLTYKRSMTKDSVADMTIENDKVDWLLEQTACYAGSPMTFSYGFLSDKMSKPVTLALGDIEPSYSKGVTLSITSADGSKPMKNTTSPKIYKGMSADDIAKEIAAYHQMEIVIQSFLFDPASQIQNINSETGISTNDTNQAHIQAYKDDTAYKTEAQFSIVSSFPTKFPKFNSLPQAWHSNFHMLKLLAAFTGLGFVTYVNKGKLYFVQKFTNGKAVDTITRGITDNLISFNVKYRELNGNNASQIALNNKKYTPASTDFVVSLGKYQLIASNGVGYLKNPDGSLSIADDANLKVAIDQTPFKGTVFSVDDAKKFVIGHGGTYPSSAEEAEKDNVANIDVTAQKQKLLTADLVEVGNVDRDINSVITMAGIATRYCGNWFVEEVTDNITQNGFITTSQVHKGETNDGIVPTKAPNLSQGDGSDPVVHVSAVSGGWDTTANNPNNKNQQITESTPTTPASNFTISSSDEEE